MRLAHKPVKFERKGPAQLDAGTLLNNISQYMRGREMQQFSEGGTLEGTVEVSVICKQNPDGSPANKDCK
jgi:hypothetical protein